MFKQTLASFALVALVAYLSSVEASPAPIQEAQDLLPQNYVGNAAYYGSDQQVQQAQQQQQQQPRTFSNSDNDSEDEDDDDDIANAQAQLASMGYPISGNEQALSGAGQFVGGPPTGQFQQAASASDLRAAASHHKHHGHGAKGWLDMGAWTGKKGAFGWHDKHPVGKKGRK